VIIILGQFLTAFKSWATQVRLSELLQYFQHRMGIAQVIQQEIRSNLSQSLPVITTGCHTEHLQSFMPAAGHIARSIPDDQRPFGRDCLTQHLPQAIEREGGQGIAVDVFTSKCAEPEQSGVNPNRPELVRNGFPYIARHQPEDKFILCGQPVQQGLDTR